MGAVVFNRKDDPAPPPPLGPPFLPTSANNGLSVSGGGVIVLGNDVGGNAALLISNRDIPMGAFAFRMLTGVAERQLVVSPSTFEYVLGNLDDPNPTDRNAIFIQSTGSNITTITNGGARTAVFQTAAGGNQDIEIGDVDNQTNRIIIQINNTLDQFRITSLRLGGTQQCLLFQNTTRQYVIGDVQAGDTDRWFRIDELASLTTFNNMAIKTAVAGAGSGNWKLGTIVAGAAVLDATRFVEVDINGTLIRLAVIV